MPATTGGGEGDELIGGTLGHFRVVKRLGQGGMGVVYRAIDEGLRREVALKVLPTSVTNDVGRRQRFLREARSAAAVTHPNLVMVHEVGEAAGRVFIAMELVAGESLGDRLERGPMPWTDAVRIAREVARGLSRAHEAGIVHRDLKPDNVMLGSEQAVKILDFGLAKSQGSSDAPTPHGATASAMLTEDGQILGTPGYMSPEQAAGRQVDARGDLFALGVMLYEMVSGARPFQGNSAIAVLAATMRDEPRPLAHACRGLPPALDAIIMRLLRKDPAARYASAREVVIALDAMGVHPFAAPTPEGAAGAGAYRRPTREEAAPTALGRRDAVVGYRDPARPPAAAPAMLASSAGGNPVEAVLGFVLRLGALGVVLLVLGWVAFAVVRVRPTRVPVPVAGPVVLGREANAGAAPRTLPIGAATPAPYRAGSRVSTYAPAAGAASPPPIPAGTHDCTDGADLCSEDRSQVLRCNNGRLMLTYRTCQGPHACTMQGADVVCDQSLAGVGDGCVASGLTACSKDLTQLLRCDGRAFARVRVCPTACSVAADGAASCN
jgi:serine/threonine-protein kinase